MKKKTSFLVSMLDWGNVPYEAFTSTFFFVAKKTAQRYQPSGAPGIGGGGINVPLLMMLNRFLVPLTKRSETL